MGAPLEAGIKALNQSVAEATEQRTSPNEHQRIRDVERCTIVHSFNPGHSLQVFE